MFRSIFIALSESKMLRAIAERSRIGRRLSSRFVAGMTVDDALHATAATNSHHMSVSVDNLGENVTNVAEAEEWRVAIPQLTVGVQLNVGPDVCASETKVVPAGSASVIVTLCASLGPLLVIVTL